MKKVLLLSVMAIMTLALNAQQLAFAKCQVPAIQKAVAEENTMQFSYCGDFATMLGFRTAGTIRAVIEVPAETASKYNGTQVTNVKVGIGSFGLNPGAQIVFLRDLEGSEPIYSQEFKPTQKSWNEVTLETPFTITNEKFYVGYQIKVTSNQHYPLSIDNTAANALGDIVGLLDTKTNTYQYVHLGEQGFNNNCIVLTLTGDNLPQYDLTLDKLSVKEYIKTGDAFSISGSIKNAASKTINTFDLTYQIGNAEAQTQAITVDGGLANSQYYNFKIDNLIINEDGVNDITVTVSNPNGQADEYDADNTITKQTTASSLIVPRKILLEHFSTAQCPNCPPVHDMLHELLEGRNDVAWVVHHTGFNEDTYTIQPSRDYMWFYGNIS